MQEPTSDSVFSRHRPLYLEVSDPNLGAKAWRACPDPSLYHENLPANIAFSRGRSRVCFDPRSRSLCDVNQPGRLWRKVAELMDVDTYNSPEVNATVYTQVMDHA